MDPEGVEPSSPVCKAGILTVGRRSPRAALNTIHSGPGGNRTLITALPRRRPTVGRRGPSLDCMDTEGLEPPSPPSGRCPPCWTTCPWLSLVHGPGGSRTLIAGVRCRCPPIGRRARLGSSRWRPPAPPPSTLCSRRCSLLAPRGATTLRGRNERGGAGRRDFTAPETLEAPECTCAETGLNRRPPPCRGGAVPLSQPSARLYRVPPPGIEPGSSGLQPDALTTSARAANRCCACSAS